MIIEKEDIATLDAIRNYTHVSKVQVITMQNFMSKYIENNIQICNYCPAQIKFAWNRIINWSNINSESIEAVRNGSNINQNK
jgi:hypothetical protein